MRCGRKHIVHTCATLTDPQQLQPRLSRATTRPKGGLSYHGVNEVQTFWCRPLHIAHGAGLCPTVGCVGDNETLPRAVQKRGCWDGVQRSCSGSITCGADRTTGAGQGVRHCMLVHLLPPDPHRPHCGANSWRPLGSWVGAYWPLPQGCCADAVEAGRAKAEGHAHFAQRRYAEAARAYTGGCVRSDPRPVCTVLPLCVQFWADRVAQRPLKGGLSTTLTKPQ